jgi:hypothetical protein
MSVAYLTKVLTLCLLTTLTVLGLLSTASFMVPVHTQEQYSISTDKPAYNVGETVTIYVNPTPPNGFGVYPWIVVTKPDQLQVHLDLEIWSNNLTLGQVTTRLVADIAGQYRVDLVFEKGNDCAARQFVMCDLQRMATCYFQAGGNQTLKLQPETANTITTPSTEVMPKWLQVRASALSLANRAAYEALQQAGV